MYVPPREKDHVGGRRIRLESPEPLYSWSTLCPVEIAACLRRRSYTESTTPRSPWLGPSRSGSRRSWAFSRPGARSEWLIRRAVMVSSFTRSLTPSLTRVLVSTRSHTILTPPRCERRVIVLVEGSQSRPALETSSRVGRHQSRRRSRSSPSVSRSPRRGSTSSLPTRRTCAPRYSAPIGRRNWRHDTASGVEWISRTRLSSR